MSGGRAWAMWSFVALTYALAFLQRIAPHTILDRLMADFTLGATEVGLVTSAYFYGYMIMQLPAGVIVDRWGVRTAVLISLTVSGIGTFWFARAGGQAEAVAARTLVALGDALVFTSLVKQAVQRFPPGRFGLITGLGQVCGYLGGLAATAPLALVVATIGWRGAFNMLAVALAITLLFSLIFLRDAPIAPTSPPRSVAAILHDTALALKCRTTWGPITMSVGAYVASLSLSGVWAGSLLMQGYSFSRTSASFQMLIFMAGYALGALTFGYLADTCRTLRRPVIAVTVVRILLMGVLTPAVGSQLPVGVITICLAGLGLLAGGMVPLVLSSLRLTFARVGLGTGVSINSMIENMANGLAQPFLGAILEYHWTGVFVAGVKWYSPNGYTWLLLALAGISLLSVLGALFSADKDGD